MESPRRRIGRGKLLNQGGQVLVGNWAKWNEVHQTYNVHPVKGKMNRDCMNLGCKRNRCISNGGVHQNSHTPFPRLRGPRTGDKREITSGSRAETVAQYQLLKADGKMEASQRRR